MILDSIRNYQSLGYRTLEIPYNRKDPKALVAKWKDQPSTDLITSGMFAVVQEENKIVFDIDDTELNDVLEYYLDKTLVTETGNGGRHYYFKDIVRTNPIRTTKLFKGNNIIGDIKANLSYVVGIGSKYHDINSNTEKQYRQISSCNDVLELDCEQILSILKTKGIATKKKEEISIDTKSKLIDPATTGDRNNQCFKKALLVLKDDSDFDSASAFMKTWNQNNDSPLPDYEVEACVRSAKNTIDNKDESIQLNRKDEDKITTIANRFIEKYNPVTAIDSDTIYIFNGKIYDNQLALKLIKEETENQIKNCSSHDPKEVEEKIKRKTFTNLTDFDSDPKSITCNNGILNLDTMELRPHTPANLSKILIPCDYITPESDDIETNLKDTLFWKYITSSFTVEGKLDKDGLTNALEMMASCFIKHNVDEKSFMLLGNGENGKSVCLDYLSSLLGLDNVSHIPLQTLSENQFACSRLDGKLANLFADIPDTALKKADVIKVISTGEPLHVEKKYHDGYDMYPISKLIFSCNRFPRVYDQSQGFFRRWIIIQWKRNFESDPDRIEHLKDQLTTNQEEKNLVFSSLMQLTKQLETNDEFTINNDWKRIQKIWNESADPIGDFADNYIIEKENSRKTKRETYQFYKKTMYDKGEIPKGVKQFSLAFEQYFDWTKSNGIQVWDSIDFKEHKQIQLEERES